MSIRWEKGTCVYCGLPIVMHGRVVPVFYHAACAHALRALPEDRREAVLAERQREREGELKQREAKARAEKAGAPMLPLGF